MSDGTCACCGGPAAKKYCSRDCYHLGSRKSERLTVTCPCGRSFETTARRVADGRGKFCSKACRDANATRPSGLKYNITKVNAGQFKPGRAPNETSFKPGQAAWNKGIPSGAVPPSAFPPGNVPWNKGTKGVMPAWEQHHQWLGEDVGYTGLHIRLQKIRGKASRYACSFADETCKGPMQWANISGNYESVDDFMPLCASHHIRYDRRAR